MDIFNSICFGCATVLVGATLLLAIGCFVASVMACFQKKVKANLVAKIFVAVVIGSLCPLLARLAVFFATKI